MVTIVDFKTFENEDEEKFHVLIVQGGLEAVKSKETGQTYFTAKTARVSCTFDENTCKSLIGTEIPGTIKKVEVEPYEMINSQTGEVTMYSKRNVFIGEDDNEQEVEQNDVVENNLVAEEEVI
ncbi:hypothetical protein GUB10_13760 [Salegentibacter sp. BLCTC]|uniref:hypothetical protein n=1 Tax=Salegentibacter sp. BLCTC TaxID=2697368 RepID=UPI00187B89A5|nr:hypothetical protein [Salegentibacter sp. BLCTC]MBE7641401.1 hypothetical protein [Salegentibacter sp. BLCTC]